MFIIIDWAGNDLTYFHGKFKTWDDAEEALSIFLGDKYETDRSEYYIVRESEVKSKRFLHLNDVRDRSNEL